MERIKILVDIPFFLSGFEDFVLIDALDALKYNFKEVVNKLNIEDEVKEFYGKSLDKYSGVDQFEKIIEDILSGTKPDQYESLLIKMYQNFLIPDHIFIVNPGNLPVDKFKRLAVILSQEIKISSNYRSELKRMDIEKYHQMAGIIQDFCNEKKGVYCFILLHKTDFSIIGHDKVKETFENSVKGIYSNN